MKIEIWSDIACPWCCLGKRRLENALASFPHRAEVELVWHSFELDPSAPPSYGMPIAELLARKYQTTLEKTTQMNRHMEALAASEGLTFRLDQVQAGNTFDAHRLLHFAAERGRGSELMQRLMLAYLGEGALMSDHATLARLAGEAGLDAREVLTVLESDRYAERVRADEERAHAFGINGVPFVAIDNRYGISGAQPAEVFLKAMRDAWDKAILEEAAPK